ncbi:ankyrin repeat-containing domain protein [Trichoderma evansii]
MGRQGLRRSLKNLQGKLPGWLWPEDQYNTSGSHTSEPQKQILTNPQSDNAPINELWNIAYEKLRAESSALIEEYERKLQGNLVAGLGSMSNASMRDRMQTILEYKMNEVNANTWKLKFRSSEVEVRDIVQPVLGVVSLVNEYVTDAMSVNPYASLAWAGISLLLPLFINPSSQMASLAKGLEFISTLIAQSRMREELYIRRYGLKTHEDQPFQKSHHEYKNGLERLYRQILKFQARAYCYFTDSSASRICLDITKQNDWDQLIDGIREQETMFAKLSTTWRDIQYDNECSAAENRHQETMSLWFTIGANVLSLERAIQEAQDQEGRINLLKWLCDIDHTELYNSARHKHTNGTGEWLIYRREVFKTWEKSTASKSFLWLHGKAGSGKSVLSSSVIKHLQDQHKGNATNVLAYFYFSFSDSQKQKVDGMLSSLIKQISARRPHIPQAVQSLGEYKNDGGRPDTKTLMEALIASMQGFSAVYIIIDALDECPMIDDERKKLLNSLRHILQVAPDSLHMFCTSRKEVDIDKAIRPLLSESWGEEVDLSDQVGVLNNDIAQYIDSILADADYDTWPKSIKEETKIALMEKADGMFQYIRCQFENLQKLSSVDAVRKALQDLPRGLDLTYNRMLQSIDEDFQPQVIASLKWLAFAIEPLEIGLLAEIFVLPPTPDEGFERISPLFSPIDVLKYFPGLIVIQEVGAQKIHEERKKDLHVRLAHFSIKEYLTSDRIFQSHASSFAFTESDAHMHIGHLCLAYHLHISSMTRISDFYKDENRYKKKLLTYASLNWAEHLEMIPHASWPLKVSRNAVLSMSIRSQSLLLMVSNYYPYKDLIWRPHCFTAMRGFRQLTEMLISRSPGFNKYLTQVDLDEGLRYATDNRRKSIAKLFLDNGAQMHDYLEKAAEQGDAAIVGLLLDHGAETNVIAGKLDSALRATLWGGHLDLLKLLLSRGADVNSPFRKAQYMPKLWESRRRQPHTADCLRFLFNNGAGVDMNTNSSLAAALFVAISLGYTEVSRLLLERGANVNDMAGQDSYPLHAAIVQMDPDIEFVRYLLDLGADPNAQGGGFGTALQAACTCITFNSKEKMADIMKLLIDKGADASIKGGKYDTALQAACSNHNVPNSVVQLLLEKGADVNAQGGEYGNALQAACQGGFAFQERKLEVVQLLLSCGADVQARGGYYGTALQAACAEGYINIVSLLINHGVDVNVQGGRYGTALQAACGVGDLRVAKLLLEHGADVNFEGGYYGTAFQAACAGGDIKVVRLLLKHGANIHVRNNGAWHTATQSANADDDLVILLLNLGVDVNDPHGPYGSALHTSLRHSWDPSALFLAEDTWSITDEPNVNDGDSSDGSDIMGGYMHFPADWAYRIRLLLRRGADPNIAVGEYGTVLQIACTVKPDFPYESKNVYFGVAGPKLLLEICPDIDVNAQGGKYGSALQAAAYSGQTTSITFLLNKGAHVDARGGKYGSALNAAVIAGNWDIVQILLDAGAVPDCHTIFEPDEEWLQRVLEDKDDGQEGVERYRKFWEVEKASKVHVDKEGEKE